MLIGELRDLETIEAALTISETGHLVLGTLHTNNAVQSINRIIDVFPSNHQQQIRAQLSFTLQGVVTQTLIPNAEGPGRSLALEIMVPNIAIRNLIRDDKVHQIYSVMQTGQATSGMQTMNQSLFHLYVRRLITARRGARPLARARRTRDDAAAQHRARALITGGTRVPPARRAKLGGSHPPAGRSALRAPLRVLVATSSPAPAPAGRSARRAPLRGLVADLPHRRPRPRVAPRCALRSAGWSRTCLTGARARGSLRAARSAPRAGRELAHRRPRPRVAPRCALRSAGW